MLGYDLFILFSDAAGSNALLSIIFKIFVQAYLQLGCEKLLNVPISRS